MTMSPSSLRSLHDYLAQLDLLEHFPRLGEYLDRADVLREQAGVAPQEYQRRQRALVDDLAEGRVTAEDAAERVIEALAATDRDGEGQRTLKAASEAALRKAERLLATKGEAIVTDLLAPEVDKITAETEKVYAALPEGVNAPEEAIAAGTKASNAWRRLDELTRRWDTVCALIRDLRRHDLLRGNPNALDLFWDDPNHVNRLTRNVHATLQLAVRIGNGHPPAVRTVAQLEAHLREQSEQAERERAAQNPPSKGRSATRYATPREDVRWALDEITTREKVSTDA